MRKPAYKRIQEHILSEIESGKLQPGKQIPTEIKLAETFGVSRMTVNKALVALSEQKKLTRIAGKGTFVTPQKAELPLTHTVDFSEEIELRGHVYHAETLAQEVRPIYDDDAVRLGVSNGADVGYCAIIHHENELPLVWERRYVNLLHVPDFLKQDFTKTSPTAYLLKYFALTDIEHTIEAIAADKLTAETLDIERYTPCLQVLRRTWVNKDLISYTRLITAGDRYKLCSYYQT